MGNQGCIVARSGAWVGRRRPARSLIVSACLIRITMTEVPTRDQLAAAVLGFVTVRSLTGLDTIAIVWPDATIITDVDLNRLADQWVARHPWM